MHFYISPYLYFCEMLINEKVLQCIFTIFPCPPCILFEAYSTCFPHLACLLLEVKISSPYSPHLLCNLCSLKSILTPVSKRLNLLCIVNILISSQPLSNLKFNSRFYCRIPFNKYQHLIFCYKFDYLAAINLLLYVSFDHACGPRFLIH